MSREEVRKMLGEGATEEQISAVLNSIHGEKSKVENLERQNQLQNETNVQNEKLIKELQDKLATIEKEKMSEAEKLELDKKETAKNLADSRKVLSRAKAQEILSKVGITDDDIIATCVTDNIDNTIANATILANKFKFVQEETEKKTKEQIATLDIKPTPTNLDSNDNNDVMNIDKFSQMTAEEQERFINENPEQFKNL